MRCGYGLTCLVYAASQDSILSFIQILCLCILNGDYSPHSQRWFSSPLERTCWSSVPFSGYIDSVLVILLKGLKDYNSLTAALSIEDHFLPGDFIELWSVLCLWHVTRLWFLSLPSRLYTYKGPGIHCAQSHVEGTVDAQLFLDLQTNIRSV